MVVFLRTHLTLHKGARGQVQIFMLASGQQALDWPSCLPICYSHSSNLESLHMFFYFVIFFLPRISSVTRGQPVAPFPKFMSMLSGYQLP